MKGESTKDVGLEKLKRDYQAIEAPPYIESRIRACLPIKQRITARWWVVFPGFAFAFICFFWFWPQSHQSTVVLVKPKLPTFADTQLPSAPRMVFPSYSKIALGHLNSNQIRMPSMPSLSGAASDVKPAGRS